MGMLFVIFNTKTLPTIESSTLVTRDDDVEGGVLFWQFPTKLRCPFAITFFAGVTCDVATFISSLVIFRFSPLQRTQKPLSDLHR